MDVKHITCTLDLWLLTFDSMLLTPDCGLQTVDSRPCDSRPFSLECELQFQIQVSCSIIVVCREPFIVNTSYEHHDHAYLASLTSCAQLCASLCDVSSLCLALL